MIRVCKAKSSLKRKNDKVIKGHFFFLQKIFAFANTKRTNVT
jgi:hypothetical protein